MTERYDRGHILRETPQMRTPMRTIYTDTDTRGARTERASLTALSAGPTDELLFVVESDGYAVRQCVVRRSQSEGGRDGAGDGRRRSA